MKRQAWFLGLTLLAGLALPTAAEERCLAVSSKGEVAAVQADVAGAAGNAPPAAPGAGADRYWCWSSDQPPLRSKELSPAAGAVDKEMDRFRIVVELGGERECSGLDLLAAPAAMWAEVPEAMLPRTRFGKACTITLPRWAGETWRLRLSGHGLGTWWQEADPRRSEFLLRPTAAATLRFQVVDLDEEPVPAAHLDVLTSGRAGQTSNLARFVEAGGWIEIPSLPQAPPVLALFGAQGFVPRSYDSPLHALPQRVSLQPSVTLRGRFVDREKRPVAGAKILAEAWLDRRARLLVRRIGESSAEGRWAVEGLPAGEVVVRAESEGRASWRRQLEVQAPEFDFGAVRLERGMRLILRVLDPGGLPIPDAEVKAGLQARGMSDSQGRAELQGLQAARSVRVEADAQGYLATQTVLDLTENTPPEVILQPAFEVRGRYLDADGVPVAGGRAEIVDGASSQYLELDAGGEFRFELEPGKAMELRLTSKRTRRLVLDIEPGLAGALLDLGDLQAPSGLRVSGRVIGAGDEAPIPGARVWAPRPSARDPLTAWFHGDLLEASTDAEGQFVLSGLGRRPATLIVDAPRFARARFRVTPRADERHVDLGDLRLSRGTQVEVVVEESISPAAVARLDLVGRWREMDMLTLPLDQGRALFEQVPPGSATLTVLDGDRLVCEETVDVSAELETTEVICRRRSMTVTGVVHIAGYPAGPGRLLWLPTAEDTTGIIMRRSSALGLEQSYIVGGGRPQVDVEVAADGHFMSEALRDGAWNVAWISESGGSSSKKITLPRQEWVELQLDFPGQALEGEVVDADGRPVAGARVRELSSGSTAWSQEDGSFRILGLVPGEHFLRADLEGEQSETLRVLLEPEQPSEWIRLVLAAGEPEEALQVFVFDAGENPLPGAFVFLDSGATGLRVLTTNAQGRTEARLDPPYPAQIRLAAWADGAWHFGEPRVYAEALDEPLVLSMRYGGSLELRSRETSGAVQLISDHGWDVTSLMRRLGLSAFLRPEEPLVLEGLPAGTYQIGVGNQLWQARVRSGRHEVVDLD